MGRRSHTDIPAHGRLEDESRIEAAYYDRTLPGGLRRLGRRRDLYDVGDAS